MKYLLSKIVSGKIGVGLALGLHHLQENLEDEDGAVCNRLSGGVQAPGAGFLKLHEKIAELSEHPG
jgi:hypothetical protein